jgi:hypothetical protein
MKAKILFRYTPESRLNTVTSDTSSIIYSSQNMFEKCDAYWEPKESICCRIFFLNMAGESLFLTARYSTKRILHLLIY